MKILQINNYNYLKGGSEKVYQTSIEVLQHNGHDVRFFSVADKQNQNLCDGVAVSIDSWHEAKGFLGKIRGIKKFIYNNHVAQQLDRLIGSFHPDVAHLHIFYGTLSNAVIDVLRKHKIPMVQTVHEFRMLCPAYTCLNPQFEVCEACSGKRVGVSCIKNRCVKNSLPISIVAVMECLIRDRLYNYQKNISAFIMVSRFIQEKHLTYYPEMKQKCHQIYNSVDLSFYAKHITLPANKGDYYLYLGRLSREKGMETLINTFMAHPDLKLKIAGNGPEADRLKEKVLKSGNTHIEFMGFVAGESLYDLIAKARYTVIPSEWYENNPLSVIESLALGTPVIGSNIGGIPELIEEGKNGFLHKHRDQNSLSHVIQKAESISVEEYDAQCEYAIQLAERKFDNIVYYNKIIAVYKQVIKAKDTIKEAE